MKNMKKLATLLLALVMVFSLATTAFAAGTASITIKTANGISVEGRKFTAYKVLDLKKDSTGTKYAYEVIAGHENWYKTQLNITDAELEKETLNVLVQNKLNAMTSNSDGLFAFAAAAVKEFTTAAGTATGGTGADKVQITGLDEGYYVIVDNGIVGADNEAVKVISALILDSTNVDVNIKAAKPNPDKKIVDNNNQSVDANQKAVGDTVNYEITDTVPDMTGYKEYFYVATDTLSKGLTYNNDMVITVGGVAQVASTDYTLTVGTYSETTGTSLEIVFHDFEDYTTGSQIKITYSATLNQNAVAGAEGNVNTFKLTYSNDPNQTGDGTDSDDKPDPSHVTGETPEKKTLTFTTGLKLTKTDNSETPVNLTGAKFKIEGNAMNVVLVNKEIYKESTTGTYYRLKDGTYTTTAPVTAEDGNTVAQYEDITKKYEKVTEVTNQTNSSEISTEGWVNASGVMTFDGLAAGAYTITELVSPAGYNLLKDPITVVVSAKMPDSVINGDEEATWSATVNGKDATVKGGIIEFDVQNRAGSELPSTGGMGTTLFYAIGGILVLAAVVLLVTKRRMNAR